VILDEGHKIKNPANKCAKGVHFIRARNRIVLSGTPIMNNLKVLASYHSLSEYPLTLSYHIYLLQLMQRLQRISWHLTGRFTRNRINCVQFCRISFFRRERSLPCKNGMVHTWANLL